jgi:hypothetical protein
MRAGPFCRLSELGPKAFELSAGFLRVRNGDDPLDASGVHPEAYPVVGRILAATNSQLERLIGNTSVLRQIEPEAFTVPIQIAALQPTPVSGAAPTPHPALRFHCASCAASRGNAQLACDLAQRQTAAHQQGYRFLLNSSVK